MAAGETLTVIYNVTVSDGTATSTKPVTMTITGTNDAPVVAPARPPRRARSPSWPARPAATSRLDSASGTLAFTDVDLTNTHSVSQRGPASVGRAAHAECRSAAALTTARHAGASDLKTDSTGSGSGSVGFTFSAADSNFDFLAEGQTLTVTYNVTVKDSSNATSTQPVTFTITGTNDAPMLAADGSAPRRARSASWPAKPASSASDTASGRIAFTDVDLDDTHT